MGILAIGMETAVRLDHNRSMEGTRFGGPGAASTVRAAVPTDCGAIAGIYNQAIRSRRATMDTEPVGAARFEQTLARLSARECLLVAAGEAGVSGWGSVKAYSDRPGYAIACETSVYIDEAEQGRGIGSLLVEALVSRAGELGYRHLVARIMGVNQESIGFHARHGFELVGRQQSIGELDGVLHDVVIMQRILPDVPASTER